MATKSYTLADGTTATVDAGENGVPLDEGIGALTKAIKAKINASSSGGASSKLDATLELVNATASGYSYSDITTELASNTSDPRYLNSSTRTYHLEPRTYYGGENETFTFEYTGDTNRVCLVPLYNSPWVVMTNDSALTYSVMPGGDYKWKYKSGSYDVPLELKRTSEDTYVLTLTTSSSAYAGYRDESYLLIFSETDNYNGIAVYIYLSVDE